MQCLRQLWDDLHNVHGVRFLMTDRLNQDCAENLFSIIRGKGGNRDNPDARCFRAALRQVMVDRIMIPSSRGNCKEDVDAFLFSLNQKSTPAHVFLPDVVSDPEIPESVRSLMAVFTLPQALSCEEENILTYIAGYICRKISSKVCEECRGQLSVPLDDNNPSHMFLSEKSYQGAKKGGLVVPSEALTALCTDAETIYREKCQEALHSTSVRTRLVSAITKGAGMYFTSCACPLIKLTVNLFVNIRLHHTLKEGNRDFVSVDGRRNRKLLKLKHV